MAGEQHGRYYAQELAVDKNTNVLGQIQSALDEGEGTSGDRRGHASEVNRGLDRSRFFLAGLRTRGAWGTWSDG